MFTPSINSNFSTLTRASKSWLNLSVESTQTTAHRSNPARGVVFPTLNNYLSQLCLYGVAREDKNRFYDGPQTKNLLTPGVNFINSFCTRRSRKRNKYS